FGKWAATHIKSRVGAQLATILFGMMIFVDDYFNCLTVGSVMRPVTDKHRISRAKLAYLIDATAAPICIIAPISSWAAAVTGFVAEEQVNGFELFLRAIPFNFYAVLTIIFMILLTVSKADFGPMKLHEMNALKGDLFTSDAETFKGSVTEDTKTKGKVIDLIFPVVVLIVSCIIGMIYTGGFFDGVSFINAFSDCDASQGLVFGSFVTLIITVAYFIIRRVISFKDCMGSIPEGFKAMVPAIMILACAWTLKTITDSLGAGEYIEMIVDSSAASFAMFLPAIIFLIAVGLSFATGTSWGTFGILIPLVLKVVPYESGVLSIIAISACMAGAVCGDHCSPISDTTIMASAGSNSNHINHVSTQLPYALTVAGISFVTYVIAGITQRFIESYAINAAISLGLGVVLTAVMVAILKLTKKKSA
ncbi:MAG: Na+/H+ antiporter NhaC family protein, partial [Clostridia bacterium]|nr:Na+/H+ antiporter NhaC family protein [Clostridia bacterium]